MRARVSRESGQPLDGEALQVEGILHMGGLGMPLWVSDGENCPCCNCSLFNTSVLVEISEIEGGWLVKTRTGSFYRVERL